MDNTGCLSGSDLEYLEKHGIKRALDDIIGQLTDQKPEDPYQFLVDRVSTLSLNSSAKTTAHSSDIATVADDKKSNGFRNIEENFRNNSILNKLKEFGLEHEVYGHENCATADELVSKVSLPSNGKETHTKNLFFKDKKHGYFLVSHATSTTFNTKKLGALLELKGKINMRLAPNETLNKYLKVQPGCVGPMCIINDDSKEVKLVVDKTLTDGSYDYIHSHPLRNDASVKVKPDVLIEYFKKVGIQPTVVDFSANNNASPSATDEPSQAVKNVDKENKSSRGQKKGKEDVNGEAKKKKETGPKKGGGVEAKKAEDVPLWYEQVITKSEMMEYYPVKGCYIYRPWAYKTWELIQGWFDKKIKELGVENCYFPLFIPKSYLEREKDHLDDFAPEIAMVTKCGNKDLEEPVSIRPTSETAMYAAFKNWIQSHRDLPLKLNQWCNVVRMEVRQTNFFLRHREFLWQEGHTAHATRSEAESEVRQILELYASVYEYLMAVPCIRGKKTRAETFPGAEYTETVEVFIPATGRALQGATSHHLGQRFAKMFGIEFQDPTDSSGKKREFAWQNSWGLSTRSMAAPIMVHGDDRGLVLPPRIAGFQVVIVPVGIKANSAIEAREQVARKCEEYREKIASAGIRVKLDERDQSPGWKFNFWEMKGVPLRIEVGPRDIEKGLFIMAKRNYSDPKLGKLSGTDKDVVNDVMKVLNDVQIELYKKALAERDNRIATANVWSEFSPLLNAGKMVLIPFCGDPKCEDMIKEKSKVEASEAEVMGGLKMGAKSLCVPLEEKYQIDCPEVCINPDCPINGKVKRRTLFGRSY